MAETDAWRLLKRLGAIFLWGILAPIACTTAIVALSQSLPEEIRASRGEGQPGVFTAVDRSCTYSRLGDICSWDGTFRSLDGTVSLNKAHLSNDTPDKVGDQVNVLYLSSGAPPDVYEVGSKPWVKTVLLIGAAALYLIGCAGWLLRRRIARGRRG